MAQDQVAKKKSIRVLAGLVIAGIVLVGGSLYFYHQSHASPYNYHYKNLSVYKVPGSAAGSGATFDKPMEYNSTTPSKDIKTRADLEYKSNINGKAVTLGSIHVQSNSVSSPDIISYLASSIKGSLKQSGPKQASGFKYYAENALPSKDKVTITGVPQALKTPNTSSNAWYVFFSAKSSNQTEPARKGEMLILLGKSTFYTFVIEAVDKTWDGNQAVWQQVINSIKIDQ